MNLLTTICSCAKVISFPKQSDAEFPENNSEPTSKYYVRAFVNHEQPGGRL